MRGRSTPIVLPSVHLLILLGILPWSSEATKDSPQSAFKKVTVKEGHHHHSTVTVVSGSSSASSESPAAVSLDSPATPKLMRRHIQTAVQEMFAAPLSSTPNWVVQEAQKGTRSLRRKIKNLFRRANSNAEKVNAASGHDPGPDPLSKQLGTEDMNLGQKILFVKGIVIMALPLTSLGAIAFAMVQLLVTWWGDLKRPPWISKRRMLADKMEVKAAVNGA